jgi:hypothetical protein
MGLPSNTNALQNGFWQGYTVNRSLRFRASATAYLNRTPASASNRTTWTWSGWVKRGSLTADMSLFQGYSDANNYTVIILESANRIQIQNRVAATATFNCVTTAVYRDPSAWYHIAVAFDTTQAVSTDRIKLWVNGVRVTSFDTQTIGSQNATGFVNNNNLHSIGRSGAATQYFDGYLAEVNFIDGQALTPSSFGLYDSNGIWQPQRYTGSYGTNGFYLPFRDTTSTTTLVADASGNGNNWTPNNISLTTGTGKYLGNISGSLDLATGGSPSSMFKGSIAAPAVYPAAGVTATLTPYSPISFSSSARVYVGIDLNGPSTGLVVNSTNFGAGGVANNSNGWVTVTSAGSPITTMSWTRASAGSQGMRIFAVEIDGVILIDNVIYGSNYDSMTDSPTSSSISSNYSVFNTLDKSSSITTSNANLSATLGIAGWLSIRGSIGVSSGQWYWEVLYSAGVNMFVGIGTAATTLSSYPGSTSSSYGLQASNGSKYNNAAATAYTSAIAANDVIGVAFDATNGTLTYYKNGTSLGTAFTSIPSNTYFPMFGCDNNTIQVNFGQRPFYYTPPTGYTALNTVNLPVPTILNGALYNAATIYTGTGASQAIANSQSNGGNNALGKTFYPDFNWIKSRSGAVDHALMNSVVGATYGLTSNNTGAEFNQSANFSSFNSNGFTVQGTSSSYNQSSATYVAWQWNAGSGTTSSNTSGSITSTVSVNTTAGFSVVTYTGTGANATVGHGLGVAPSMMIVKSRSSATYSWAVYHTSTGSGNYLTLNATTASTALAAMWNSTAPTSSVFSIGTDNWVNANTATYVAYCFAAVKGYSAMGSFTGNGSADGPFIFTGFRPRFILYKNSSLGTADWEIDDTSRDTYNAAGLELFPNTSGAETDSRPRLDILSNGFKVRSTGAGINGSGNTMIYAAFAENPFNIARAR